MKHPLIFLQFSWMHRQITGLIKFPTATATWCIVPPFGQFLVLGEWILVLNLKTKCLQLGYIWHINITSKEVDLPDQCTVDWCASIHNRLSKNKFTVLIFLYFLTQCCYFDAIVVAAGISDSGGAVSWTSFSKGVSPSCSTCSWCLATWKVTQGKSGWVHFYPSYFRQDYQIKTWWHSLVTVIPLKQSLLMVVSPIFSLRGAEGWKKLSLMDQPAPTPPCFLFPAIVENDLFQ